VKETNKLRRSISKLPSERLAVHILSESYQVCPDGTHCNNINNGIWYLGRGGEGVSNGVKIRSQDRRSAERSVSLASGNEEVVNKT
jgi:hypothetical protein